MNSPRLTIVNMMCAIGMVAVSLAVGRALYASDPWLPAGVCLAGVAIECGTLSDRPHAREISRVLGTASSFADRSPRVHSPGQDRQELGRCQRQCDDG